MKVNTDISNHLEIYIEKVLVGDRFVFTTVGSEFEGCVIEVLGIVKDSHKVSVNGEIYPQNFNITMFDGCILLR